MKRIAFLMMLAAPYAHADSGEDARVALALASASKPAAPLKANPCGKSSCDCGCGSGESCRCAAAKKADAPCLVPDCDCGCREGKACRCYLPNPVKKTPELSKPYAAQWIAEGWTWNEAGGYWFKYPEPAPVQYQPYQPPVQQMHFMPMQSFGGGRSFGGGGGRGGC